MKLIKPIAKFTLVTQILFPLLFSATSVASAVNTKQEKINHREVLTKIQSNLPELTSKQTEDAHSMTGDELLAQGLNKSAQIISADNRLDAVENLAQSTAYGFASKQMTNWLNQYGNASIQISSDKAFSGEYFLPFYETEDNLFFSQSRIQRQDEDRTTLNLGLGYRYFMTNKMLGINSFYDHDLKNHNARWGLGAEFGADYVKLAANGYFRLTDWRNSRLSAFHDYDERPANGFDIKAEGFLPSYPQLGANIKYEKYFGDKVNLKGSNSISDLKKDPQAYTIGISYTPVPLLSFSLNQSMGDVNETKGELAVNYRFGVPLSQQLDTDLVPQMRTLMGARYNPVDRNNTIVMQYKKHEKPPTFNVNNVNQANIKASSEYDPTQRSELKVTAGYNVKLTVTLKDSNGKPVTGKTVSFFIKKMDSEEENPLEGTVSEDNDKGEYTITTTQKDINKYTYGFKVNDEPAKSTVDVFYTKSFEVDKGNQAKIEASLDTSKPSNKLTVTVGENVTLIVTLKDSDGPVTDKTVSIIRTDSEGKSSTVVGIISGGNDNGEYTIPTTSMVSGEFIYRFTVDGDEGKNTATVTYTLKSASIVKSEIEAIRHRLAPGHPTTLTVTLKDDNGNGLSVSKKVTIFENGVEKYKDYTDKDGKFTIEVPHDGEFKGHYTFSVDGNTMNGYEDVEWYYFKGVVMYYLVGNRYWYGMFRNTTREERLLNYDDKVSRSLTVLAGGWTGKEIGSWYYNREFGHAPWQTLGAVDGYLLYIEKITSVKFDGKPLTSLPSCNKVHYCEFDFTQEFK